MIIKCMMTEIERNSVREHTRRSCHQRKLAGQASSRFSPIGYRFKYIGREGNEMTSCLLPPVSERAPADRPLLVPHYEEMLQMVMLVDNVDMKPKQMLKVLENAGMDQNWRNPGTHLKCGILKSYVLSFDRRRKSIIDGVGF